MLVSCAKDEGMMRERKRRVEEYGVFWWHWQMLLPARHLLGRCIFVRRYPIVLEIEEMREWGQPNKAGRQV